MFRWRIAFVVALGVGLGALALSLDVTDLVPRLRTRIDALGAWGPVAFVALYVSATMVGVPGTPFTDSVEYAKVSIANATRSLLTSSAS